MFEKYISMQKETHMGLGELMITDFLFEEQYSCLIDFNDVLQVDLWKPNSAYMIQENSPVDVHMGRNKTQWLRRRLRQAHIHYEWVSFSSLESYIRVNSSLVLLRVKHQFPGDTHLSSTRILQTLICMCRRIRVVFQLLAPSIIQINSNNEAYLTRRSQKHFHCHPFPQGGLFFYTSSPSHGWYIWAYLHPEVIPQRTLGNETGW